MTDDAPASWYGQAQQARLLRSIRAAAMRAVIDIATCRLADEYGRLWRVLEWDSTGLDESCGYVLLECIEIPKFRERRPLRGGEPGQGPPTRGMTGVELMLALESGDWRRTRCW